MEFVIPLITLVIGWLLGLSGPRLSGLIMRPHRRKQVRDSLFVKFRQARFLLAGLIFLASSGNGTLTRQSLSHIHEIMSADRGEANTWFDPVTFGKMLEFTEEQLRTFLHPTPNFSWRDVPSLWLVTFSDI